MKEKELKKFKPKKQEFILNLLKIKEHTTGYLNTILDALLGNALVKDLSEIHDFLREEIGYYREDTSDLYPLREFLENKGTPSLQKHIQAIYNARTPKEEDNIEDYWRSKI